MKNRQILLASRPHGEPSAHNFRLVEADVPEPGPGQMLLRTVYLSLDPYMRGRMNPGSSYAAPVEVGGVVEGRSVGEVVRSNLPPYRAGALVVAGTGWQDYALSDGGLQPCSQGVLLDAFPPEKQGTARTLFGVAVIIAPIVGPTLGGGSASTTARRGSSSSTSRSACCPWSPPPSPGPAASCLNRRA